MMTKSVDVEAYGEGSSAFVQIGAGEGSVVVASTSGGTASVVVTDSGIEANFVGIDASAFDSDTSVSVVGDVVVGESASIPGKTYGAALSSDEDGNVELSVTGDITAQGEQGLAVGLAVGNADGTVEALVFGDVSAKGAEKNYGIDVYTAEDQKTNILVDGTVSGENAAVVLLQPETQIGENVSLTVWELVPDQNGATVLRQDDEEGTGLVEDEAAEKAVNYIIRINTDQQKIISLDGTTEVQGYDVAHEGEVVTLLLTVPEGYVITDAFADVAQNVSLSTDAAGNYFLTVPRGGGVELSVKLTEKKEDPATATLLGIRLVQRILTVDDQSGTIHLVFFSHGFYKVEFPDGSFENGTFSVKDGKIVLTSRSGNEMTIKNDGELTYAAEKLQNQIITFHLDDAALNVLKSNRT